MSGVGGGQRYISNKAKYLTGDGWEVIVACEEAEEVLLDFPKQMIKVFPELRSNPSFLKSKQRSDVKGRIEAALPNCETERIVVESHGVYHAVWGEWLAELLNAQHLVFLLEEDNGRITSSEYRFLQFKHSRKELATIKPAITKDLFSGYRNLPNDEAYSLVAYMGSAFEEIPFDLPFTDSVDATILSVSRLEKSYLRSMLVDLSEYCLRHPERKFRLIQVGDSSNPRDKSFFLQINARTSNLDIRMLGFMNPIPKALIREATIGIGKAGAAWQMAQCGLPTIAYTLESDVLAGYIGFDFGMTSSPAEIDPGLCLSDLLDRSFSDNEFEEQDYVYDITPRQQNFDEHFKFLEFSRADPEYYPVRSVRPNKSRFLQSLWFRFFGNNSYDHIMKLFGAFNCSPC